MIYPTSTDYELLYDLVQQGNKIFCLHFDKRIDNEVIFLAKNNATKENFILHCNRFKTKWIVPTTAYIGEKYTIHIVPRFTKRDCQWIAVVYWNNDINYYAYFGDTKLKQFKYLDSVDYSDIDIELTIEEALKQGLEIVKNLKNNLE
jgi:hypothetical protein